MAVRSRVIAARTGVVPSGGASLFTCPTGRTAILKHIVLHNASGSTNTPSVTLRTGTTTVTVVQEAIASGAVLRIGGQFLVAAAGDELRISTSPADAQVRIHVSGTLLAGDPE